MTRIFLMFFVFLFVYVAGCLVKTDDKIGGEALIEAARAKVLSSSIILSMEERKTIETQKPIVRIYRLAGEYADYSFEWIATNTRIVVAGKGTLPNLEGGAVRKFSSTR